MGGVVAVVCSFTFLPGKSCCALRIAAASKNLSVAAVLEHKTDAHSHPIVPLQSPFALLKKGSCA